MRRLVLVVVALCMFLPSAAGWAQADDALAYRLRQGDALQISVWREEGLQKDVRVLPDGSITFPLAGRVLVAGLTTTDAQKLLVTRLKEFIPEPIVTILVTGIESNRIFVLGKVLRSGGVPMTGPMTVLQALSMAGGLDKFADESGIKVIRSNARGGEVFLVNYRNLLSGQDMATNRLLEAGDVLLVP